MIYRVTSGRITLDFGSHQAALQLLDNYPPHIRDKTSLKEITAVEIKASQESLTTELRKVTRFDSENVPIQTTYTEWLLSRIDMYDKALPAVEAYEASISAQVQSRALNTWDGQPRTVNEVWRPN